MMYALSLSFFLSCTGTENTELIESSPSSDAPSDSPTEDLPGANSDSVGEANLTPVTSRDARRLSVRALSASLTQVTGIEWLEEGESPYHTYRTTLGVPDYAQSVSEDLDPGIMFYKQLINAANYSCEAMVQQDLTLPISERRLLNNISEDSSDSVEVKTALVKALVRFHGEEEDLAHDSSTLTKWYNLWQGLRNAHNNEESEDFDEQNANLMAWQLVCEALILSPNFYTY